MPRSVVAMPNVNNVNHVSCTSHHIAPYDGDIRPTVDLQFELTMLQSFPVNSANIPTNHTLPKSKFFGLRFCCRQYGVTSTTVTKLAPKVMEFGEMMQNNGDYTVQDILRISILVPTGTNCKF